MQGQKTKGKVSRWKVGGAMWSNIYLLEKGDRQRGEGGRHKKMGLIIQEAGMMENSC